MPTKIVTAPTGEPVLLADVKPYLRVDADLTADDATVTMLIAAARQDAETITRRALVTQQWKAVFDCFPVPGMNIGSATWYGPQWGVAPGPLTMQRPDGSTGFEFYLPFPPLQTVDSIKYTDLDGALQTLDPSQYIVDAMSEPARVTPAYGLGWPGARQQTNAVEVTFTCGYGAASAVPEGIKRWITMRVATIYNNREEVAVLPRGKLEVLPYVDNLLEPWRVMRF